MRPPAGSPARRVADADTETVPLPTPWRVCSTVPRSVSAWRSWCSSPPAGSGDERLPGEHHDIAVFIACSARRARRSRKQAATLSGLRSATVAATSEPNDSPQTMIFFAPLTAPR